MKKRVIMLICLLLVVSTLVSLVGCKKDSSGEADSTAESGSTADTKDNAPKYDENGLLMDQIGDDIKFDGKEVSIVGWKENLYDFGISRETPITEATYYRNKTVEDRLQVNLKFDLTIAGSNAVRYEYIQAVSNRLESGESYDLIAAYSQCPASFAIQGYLENLANHEQLAFKDSPWWSQELVDKTMINDNIYFASGPISPSSILEMMILGVNLDMLDTLRLDDPREMVVNKTWTYEEFFKLCQGVGSDLKNDGKDVNDQFAFATSEVPVDNFAQSAGISFISKTTDKDGKESLILDQTFASGTKTIDHIDTLVSKFATNDFYYTAEYVNPRNLLFFPTTFNGLINSRNEIKFNYGFLPYPMADTEQGRYYVNAGYTYSLWCMPTTISDDDKYCSAYVMECMASEGYRKIQPVIYEEAKFKLSNDSINAECYDIIAESFTYDFGRLFCNLFEPQSAAPFFIFRYAITRPTEKPFVSQLQYFKNSINMTIANINDCFY